MVFSYTFHNWSSDAQDENGVSDKAKHQAFTAGGRGDGLAGD